MVTKSAMKTLRQEQEQALEQNVPLEELARPVAPRPKVVRRAPVPQLERIPRIPSTSPARHLELIPNELSHPQSWPVPPPPSFSHAQL
jgi:hypothetical protein